MEEEWVRQTENRKQGQRKRLESKESRQQRVESSGKRTKDGHGEMMVVGKQEQQPRQQQIS